MQKIFSYQFDSFFCSIYNFLNITSLYIYLQKDHDLENVRIFIYKNTYKPQKQALQIPLMLLTG